MKIKLAVLGFGNIGRSVVEGFIKQGFSPSDIIATKRNTEFPNNISGSEVKVITSNTEAVNGSDIIIIAVKSYNFQDVLDEIKEHLLPGRHILISISTGVSLDRIMQSTGNNIPVFRAMPNIAASIGGSVSCICSKNAKDIEIQSVKKLFDLIGTTMLIEENLMESATILGSCGVAYVLRFIRAMIQGGIQIGFDASSATAIVTQTVKGAAELLIERREHPEQEIDKVTTPKGCTIVGLNEMEHNGFSSSLIKGIVASFEKIEK